ncbi:MAG: proline racemase family protein [Candidatus Marinimicrobia bacterium]|jgi:trans-L-3-hydroxyproline dehydratase|nr:proline racemase family protein [Candidatus Neomarinimicrobiota bacterium]
MANLVKKLTNWSAPSDWLKITTIDAHTAGEPLRIVTSGIPELPGNTILEKRRYVQENLDHLRKILMWEPRGHADMYGCIITLPVSQEADFGVIFMHNEGYSSMCGHGVIAITKIAIEIGLVEMVEPQTTVKIDSPAGLITATGHIENGKVKKISFQNVPSYVIAIESEIEIHKYGKIKYDLAFGGAYYAYVQAADVELTCYPKDIDKLIHVGRELKKAVSNTINITHPYDNDLSFLYGTIFIGEPEDSDSHSRNVCIFADGEVDRSPTGTGISGELAILYARGEIGIGETIDIESIIGTKFIGKIVGEAKFGSFDAIIPEITGEAFITGKQEFFVDPKDPIGEGIFIR